MIKIKNIRKSLKEEVFLNIKWDRNAEKHFLFLYDNIKVVVTSSAVLSKLTTML